MRRTDSMYKSEGPGCDWPLSEIPVVVNMAVSKFRSVSVLVWALLASLVTAQITFSRDWTGGKRAPAPLDCAQFTRLCRQFVHELKASMEAPAFGKHRRPDSDEPPTYDDDK